MADEPWPLALRRPPEQETPARSWRPVLEAFLGRLDSPHTRRGYRSDIQRAMADLRVRDLRELTGSALMLWRGALMEGPGAPMSKTRRIVAVRSFLTFGQRSGACPRLTRDVLDLALPVPRAEPLQSHRVLTEAEVGYLLAECFDAQERAMVVILCSSAPRREELAGLDGTDLVRDEAGWSLHIRGKGGRVRQTPMAADVAELVLRHLAATGRIPGDRLPLFMGNTGDRIRVDEVYSLVRRVAAAAGLGNVSPHDLRATAATRLLLATGNLYAAQLLLGHSDPATTVRYLRTLTAIELRGLIPPLPTTEEAKEKE